jgi:hypothetical protein
LWGLRAPQKGNMKDRNINLKINNITSKQWANLLIELNLVANAWKPYGPKIKIKANNFERIIKWGRRTHDDTKKNRKSGKKLESNEEFEI